MAVACCPLHDFTPVQECLHAPTCACPACWLAGLAYNQVEGATAGLAYGPGKFSAGYFYAAQAVWAGGLGETIEREIAGGCRSITVAGYSLGAAVAQLLAVRIEVRPPNELWIN